MVPVKSYTFWKKYSSRELGQYKKKSRLGKSPSVKSYVSPAQEIDILKVKSVSCKDSWSKYFQTFPIHHNQSLTWWFATWFDQVQLMGFDVSHVSQKVKNRTFVIFCNLWWILIFKIIGFLGYNLFSAAHFQPEHWEEVPFPCIPVFDRSAFSTLSVVSVVSLFVSLVASSCRTDWHPAMDKACASAHPVCHKLTRVPARRWQLMDLPSQYNSMWRHQDRPNRSDNWQSTTLEWDTPGWWKHRGYAASTNFFGSTWLLAILYWFGYLLNALRGNYYLTSCGLWTCVTRLHLFGGRGKGRVDHSSDYLKDSARQSVWLISPLVNRGTPPPCLWSAVSGVLRQRLTETDMLTLSLQKSQRCRNFW